MSQSENGQLPSDGSLPKLKGKHTGERLTCEREERIINLLSLGEPVAAIARFTRASRNTVDAVRSRRWSDVEQRKGLIRASAARLAVKGFERLNEEMDAGKIRGAALVPVTGMATDKLVLLANDPQQIQVQVTHSIDILAQINQLAQRLEQRAQGSAVQTLHAPSPTPPREALTQIPDNNTRAPAPQPRIIQAGVDPVTAQRALSNGETISDFGALRPV